MVLVGSLLSAGSLARVYQVDDPLLRTIELLSLEAGINAFSSAGPVSGYELARHMEKINRSTLSSASKELYDQVHEVLHDPFHGNIWSISFDAAFEAYWHDNPSFQFYEWIEGYTDRKPFLNGEAETVFGSHGYGVFSYAFQDEFDELNFNGAATNNPFILNGNGFAVQNSQPSTAFLGFSSEWGTLVAGRDAVHFGAGNTGNLMIGSHVPYHDFLQGSLSNSKFKYTFLAIPMNELITGAMLDNELTGGNLGEAWIPWKDSSGDGEIDTWHTLFHGALYRIYIAHRFEVDVFSRWRIALTEGTLFYVDTLDPRIFSPLAFNHNLQTFGEVNNSMGLETDLTLSPHWMLNVQVFLDQLQTSGEQNTEGKIPPNAGALLIGGRYRYSGDEWKVDGYVEGVYTSPFAYLRTGDHTDNYDSDTGTYDGYTYEETQYNLDFVHAVNMEDRVSGVNWLGYVYGPDSIVLAASLTAGRGPWKIHPSLRYIVQGERGLMIEGKIQQVEEQFAEDINMLSPSGDNPLHTLVAGFGVSRSIPEVNLTVYTRNYWVNRWDNSGYSADVQLMAGVSYSY